MDGLMNCSQSLLSSPRTRRAAPSAQRCALLIVLLSGFALPLPAQADEAGGGNKALRRLQMEVSRVQKEKAAVEAEKGELAGRLEKAEAEVKKAAATEKQARALGGEVAQLRRALADEKAHAEALQRQDETHVEEAKAYLADTVKQANERFDRYEGDITALRTRLADSDAHERQLEARVQGLEADKSQLTSDLAERGESVASCEKKNGELFQLNTELQKRYQDKGFFSLLKGSEPLTGLARVKEQNALQDLADKAYDAQIHPGTR
jgi:chromosome segregation ATPase